MDKFDFKAKIGALPVWGWGVIVAGVALVGYFIYRGRGSSPVSGVSGESTGLDAMGYQTAGIKGGSASLANSLPETNQQWLARVSRLVADTLSASPSQVYGALYKYVTGQTLTVQEQKWVDQGIKLGMSPPEGTQGVSDVTPDPVPVPTTPGVVRTLLGYIKSFTSDDIFAKYSDNTVKALSWDEWQRAGTPSPTSVTPTLSDINHYEKRSNSDTIVAVGNDGSRTNLTYDQWVTLGSPGWVTV